MEKYDLPEGWVWRKLGDKNVLTDIHPGFACGTKDVINGIPHLRMNNISKDGFLDMSLVRRIPKDKADKSGRWLETGDIIFNNTNSTELVGKTCIFSGWKERCTYSNHLTRLQCHKKVLMSEWLYFCLRELWLSGYFAVNCIEFVGQSAFNTSKLKEVEIPVPPLPEQRRIVKRIEGLTRRVEETRKLRASVIDEAEKYIPAAIASVFENGQNEGWVTKKIKDICEKPQYGYTESASHEPVGPKFLRITDIQNGKVAWEKVPYCKCDNLDKYRLKTGDIVFARTGATTGKSFLITDPPDAVFASYLIRLRVGTLILPEFLYWYFQSSSYWESVSSGIEDGNRPNMNGTKLANLEVPFPEDKDRQRSIVKHLNGLQEKVDEFRQLQIETESELSAFTPALMAKAFRGEL
ncbi:MAG: restriction endonuclease subunit S [Nitrospirae bacterium]|nr:restriction endonuclease subunit S [Nitrospirota bacterium]